MASTSDLRARQLRAIEAQEDGVLALSKQLGIGETEARTLLRSMGGARGQADRFGDYSEPADEDLS